MNKIDQLDETIKTVNALASAMRINLVFGRTNHWVLLDHSCWMSIETPLDELRKAMVAELHLMVVCEGGQE